MEKLEYIVTKILEHLSLVPSESTREQILFVLLSEIKAFPQENAVLWQKLLALLPADIMVANEKARFKSNLELMASADFSGQDCHCLHQEVRASDEQTHGQCQPPQVQNVIGLSLSGITKIYRVMGVWVGLQVNFDVFLDDL